MSAHDDELLACLKKVADWVELQRRMTKWAMLFVLLFIPAIIAFGVIMERREKVGRRILNGAGESWTDVYHASSTGDTDKAIRIGESLIRKAPGHEGGHSTLAFAYLAAGDLQRATHHFEQAYRLFPSEKNRENLAAMRKRLAQDDPAAPSGATQ